MMPIPEQIRFQTINTCYQFFPSTLKLSDYEDKFGIFKLNGTTEFYNGSMSVLDLRVFSHFILFNFLYFVASTGLNWHLEINTL